MVEVKVCVGSSCHVRGGAMTLKALKSLIESHGLTDEVNLSADLCLDNCLRAPNVVVDGTVHGGVTPNSRAVLQRQHPEQNRWKWLKGKWSNGHKEWSDGQHQPDHLTI